MDILKLFFGFIVLLETVPVCTGSNGGAADMTRLLGTILEGRKSNVLPRLNQTGPVNVYIGMGVMAVLGLDTRTQVLTFTAFLKMSWRDETLVWLPEDYGNITSVLLSQGDIWAPDIAVINSLAGSIFPGDSGVNLRLSYDGMVEWTPVFNTELYCQVDSAKYPKDVDTCVIKLGTWMYDDTQVHVEHMSGHTQMDPDVTNGQFLVKIDDPALVLDEFQGVFYSSLHFIMTLERRPGYIILSLLLPMFVIGLLTVLSFVIPADNDEKVDMSLNVMLSTTMFLSVIHDDLPDRSDAIATVAFYVIALFLMSFFGVVGNTLVLMMSQREQAQAESNKPRSFSVSNGDYSESKKCSPVSLRRPFAASQRMSKLVSGAEVTSDLAHVALDQSEGVDAVPHSDFIVFSSTAAKTNFVFLVVSALSLFIFSLATFVRIFC